MERLLIMLKDTNNIYDANKQSDAKKNKIGNRQDFSEQYYIAAKTSKRNTAGAKAPQDIETLALRRGMKPIFFKKVDNNSSKIRRSFSKLITFSISVANWLGVQIKAKKNSLILIQHPMQAIPIANFFVKFIKKVKGCTFVAIIHDLESLRKGIKGVIRYDAQKSAKADNEFLKNCDYIICHNERMKQYLVNVGFEESQLVCLEVFDYLYKNKLADKKQINNHTVIVAGNLNKNKSGYVYKLKELDSDIKFHLYGPNFLEKEVKNNIKYYGQFEPHVLPQVLEGSFGLVWDGDSLETCSGNTGEYLKYNCPHKVSLYLASQIPVIIWSKSAMAKFIEKNHLGIVVDNLNEIRTKIYNITDEEYLSICKAVKKQSDLLKQGYYFYTAMDKIISK